MTDAIERPQRDIILNLDPETFDKIAERLGEEETGENPMYLCLSGSLRVFMTRMEAMSEREEPDDFGAKANARLIAAGPDLLEALQGLVAEIDATQPEVREGCVWAGLMADADAAIAKATEEPTP